MPRKSSGGLEAGDENVVDFQQDAEAIAFARELRLIGLRSFEIERVVHGDGDLAGDALHEGEFAVVVGDAARHAAAETHGAETALRSGERNERQAADAFVAQALHEIRDSASSSAVSLTMKVSCDVPDPRRTDGRRWEFRCRCVCREGCAFRECGGA